MNHPQQASISLKSGGEPQQQESWEDRFENWNWEAIADITGGNPEESIKAFISSERQRAFDEGYKKGVADEVECIETSGEHSESVKKIQQRVLDEVREFITNRDNQRVMAHIQGAKRLETPYLTVDDLLSAIKKIKEK